MTTSAAGRPDATLVDEARRGSTAAFEGLVRRHYRAAYSTALALVGNAMDAEDVCQDAFIKALERLDGCRKPDRFAAWLLQIVRNRAHNFREYQQRRVGTPLDEAPAVSGPQRGDPADRAELRDRLHAALANLNEVQREVVLLHDLEGWKHREIAEALEMSVESSRQHLFVARKELRKNLGAHALKEYLHG